MVPGTGNSFNEILPFSFVKGITVWHPSQPAFTTPANMAKRFMEDPAATAALQEVVDLYRLTNVDDASVEQPLSGADLVDEIGLWIERNHKLLRKLGLIEEDTPSGKHS